MKSSSLLFAAAAIAILCSACNDTNVADHDSESSVSASFFQSRSSEATEDVRRYHDEVAVCMRQNGFGYEPPAQEGAESLEYISYWLDPDIERATADGFGIVDAEEDRLSRELEAFGQAPGNSGNLPTPDDETLSAEYQRSLWGEEGSDGCAATARARTESSIEVLDRDIYVAFAEELERSQELFLIEEAWSRCMSDSGHEFKDEAAAQDAVVRQVDLAVAEVVQFLAEAKVQQGPGGPAVDVEVASSVPDLPIAQLDRVRQLEVQVARTAASCMEPLSERLANELARIEDVVAL